MRRNRRIWAIVIGIMLVFSIVPLVTPVTASSPTKATPSNSTATTHNTPKGWIKIYGKKGNDAFVHNTIARFPNGDIVVAGVLNSYTLWVMRLDKNGNIKWQETFGVKIKAGLSLAITHDGDIIVAGGLMNRQALIMRLGPDGRIKWQEEVKTNVNGYSFFTSLIVLPNGDIVAAGGYNCHLNNYNLWDFGSFWVVCFSKDGKILWTRRYHLRSSPNDIITSAALSSDGNLIVGGWANDDGWVLKINSNNGSVIWQKRYGKWGWDIISGVAVLPDGDIVVGGPTSCFGFGGVDAWVAKLNPNGDILWTKAYGTAKDDALHTLTVDKDGNIIFGGLYSGKFVWGTYYQRGGADAWVVKLNPNGDIVWQKAYGWKGSEGVESIISTPNGSVIGAGWTNSLGSGGRDGLMVYIPPTGNLPVGAFWRNTNANVANYIELPEANTNAAVYSPNLTIIKTDFVPIKSNATVYSLNGLAVTVPSRVGAGTVMTIKVALITNGSVCPYPISNSKEFTVLIDGKQVPVISTATITPCEFEVQVTAPSKFGRHGIAVELKTKYGAWIGGAFFRVLPYIVMSLGDWIKLRDTSGESLIKRDPGTGIYYAEYGAGIASAIDYDYKIPGVEGITNDTIHLKVIGVKDNGSTTIVINGTYNVTSDSKGHFKGVLDKFFVDWKDYWAYYVIATSKLADRYNIKYSPIRVLYVSPVFIETGWNKLNISTIKVVPWIDNSTGVSATGSKDYMSLKAGDSDLVLTDPSFAVKVLRKVVKKLNESSEEAKAGLQVTYVSNLMIPGIVKASRNALKNNGEIIFMNNTGQNAITETQDVLSSVTTSNVEIVGPYPTPMEKTNVAGGTTIASAEYSLPNGGYVARLGYSDVIFGFEKNSGAPYVKYTNDPQARGEEYARPFIEKGKYSVGYARYINAPYAVVAPNSGVPLMFAPDYIEGSHGKASIFLLNPLDQHYSYSLDLNMVQLAIDLLTDGEAEALEDMGGLGKWILNNSILHVDLIMNTSPCAYIKMGLYFNILKAVYFKAFLEMGMSLSGPFISTDVELDVNALGSNHTVFSWHPGRTYLFYLGSKADFAKFAQEVANNPALAKKEFMKRLQALMNNQTYVHRFELTMLNFIIPLMTTQPELEPFVLYEIYKLYHTPRAFPEALDALVNASLDNPTFRKVFVDAAYFTLGMGYSAEYFEKLVNGSNLVALYGLEPASAHTLIRQISTDIAKGLGTGSGSYVTIPDSIRQGITDYDVKADIGISAATIESLALAAISNAQSLVTISMSTNAKSDLYPNSISDINALIFKRDINSVTNYAPLLSQKLGLMETSQALNYMSPDAAANFLENTVNAIEWYEKHKNEILDLSNLTQAYKATGTLDVLALKLVQKAINNTTKGQKLKERLQPIFLKVDNMLDKINSTLTRVTKYVGLGDIISSLEGIGLDSLNVKNFNEKQVHYIGPPNLSTSTYDDPPSQSTPAWISGNSTVNITLKPLILNITGKSYLLVNTTDFKVSGVPRQQWEGTLTKYSGYSGAPLMQGYSIIFKVPSNETIASLKVNLGDQVVLKNVTPLRAQYEIDGTSTPYVIPPKGVSPLVQYYYRVVHRKYANYVIVVVYPERYYETNHTAVYYRDVKIHVKFGKLWEQPSIKVNAPAVIGIPSGGGYNLKFEVIPQAPNITNLTIKFSSVKGKLSFKPNTERIENLSGYEIVGTYIYAASTTNETSDVVNISITYTENGVIKKVNRYVLVSILPDNLVDLEIAGAKAGETAGQYYVNVTVRNLGKTEVHDALVKVLSSASALIGQAHVYNIAPNQTEVIKVPIDTSALYNGSNTLNITIPQLPGEVNLMNNVKTIKVTIKKSTNNKVSYSSGKTTAYVGGYLITAKLPEEVQVGKNTTLTISLSKLSQTAGKLKVAVHTSPQLGSLSEQYNVSNSTVIKLHIVPEEPGIGNVNVTIIRGSESYLLQLSTIISEFSVTGVEVVPIAPKDIPNVTSFKDIWLKLDNNLTLNVTVNTTNLNPSIVYSGNEVVMITLSTPNGSVYTEQKVVKYWQPNQIVTLNLLIKNMRVKYGYYNLTVTVLNINTFHVETTKSWLFAFKLHVPRRCHRNKLAELADSKALIPLSRGITLIVLRDHEIIKNLLESHNVPKYRAQLIELMDNWAIRNILRAWNASNLSHVQEQMWNNQTFLSRVANYKPKRCRRGGAVYVNDPRFKMLISISSAKVLDDVALWFLISDIKSKE